MWTLTSKELEKKGKEPELQQNWTSGEMLRQSMSITGKLSKGLETVHFLIFLSTNDDRKRKEVSNQRTQVTPKRNIGELLSWKLSSFLR